MSSFEYPHTPRRVVTGVRDGKSVFVSDGPAPTTHHYAGLPGMTTTVVYATAPNLILPVSEAETAPEGRAAIPAPGEAVLLIVTFQPDSVFASPAFDPVGADVEQRQWIPGLAESFEAEHPGKHTTPSLDYEIVLDGELWLELDDEERRLGPGDIAIQAHTRHAWRNKTDRPATLCAVLIGGVTR